MSLELVVCDDAACRGGVELLDYSQVRWMLHVLPKTGSVLVPGKESVGISSGAPREVFTHGEVNRARHLISQSTERRCKILDLFFRGLFPYGEKHEMVYHSASLVPNIPTESSRKAANVCGALAQQSYGRRWKGLIWSQDLFPENP